MSTIVVAGLPSLAADLVSLVSGDLRSTPPGRPLHAIVSWDDLPAAVIVSGSTPHVSTEADALHREGCPVVVVNDGGPPWVHPTIPSITAPFSPADVLAVVGLDRPEARRPSGAERGYEVGPVPAPAPSGAVSAWPRVGSDNVAVSSGVGSSVAGSSVEAGEEVPPWIRDVGGPGSGGGPVGSDPGGPGGGERQVGWPQEVGWEQPVGWDRPAGFGADRGWGDRRPVDDPGPGRPGSHGSGGGPDPVGSGGGHGPWPDPVVGAGSWADEEGSIDDPALGWPDLDASADGGETWPDPPASGGGHGPWPDPVDAGQRWEDADRFEEAWTSTYGSDEVPWGAWGPEDDPPAPTGERSAPAGPARPARRRDGRPQVLMWTCPKGGSGKTSLSLRYAAFLASTVEPSRRVVWVDGNLQQADGARYLGADERVSRTILDLAERPDLDERDVLACLAPPSTTGRPMWSLFGPAVKADADPRIVTPELYRDVVAILRRHFDHLIVDTPVAEHHNQFFTEFVLPEADQIVVVVPPLLPVVRTVREWLDLQSRPVAAGGAALPAASVRVVLNMADDGNGCPIEAVRDAWLARWTWAGHIPHDPSWTEATNNGSLFSEHDDLAAGFAELLRATTGDIVEGHGSERSSRWFRHVGRFLRR